ncbi:lamin tail domain-containing protein [Nocardioides eburneiflavus]|uniref:Lamin tail domain-containing protein n=1 Tax=Nocardioides eburneiflavus TaxID=2518372 RepID=A0A4Z1CHF8_9ACTN|nr:lamin tail domain-containing protein [Nocardioides eburneiflavus]TGN65037.1 lamin tail domain-containing protein [Nocardioides eburneiflavus]
MRLFFIAGAAVVATLVIPLTAVQASAAAVEFTKVQYDSPGDDTGSNNSLNKEWIKITNRSNQKKTLTGWTVRDPQGHVFKFPEFKLGAGRTVTIHTGKGTDSRTDLYWRQDRYVWNNEGDKAILKNANKKLVHVCKWGSGSGSAAC